MSTMYLSYEQWLAGPRTEPWELSFSEWCPRPHWDETSDWERRFPFEDANCELCGAIIGGHLDYDPETTADRSVFTTIWLNAADQAVCEDCAFDPEPTTDPVAGVDYEVASCPVCGDPACTFGPKCAAQVGEWPEPVWGSEE